MAQEKTEKATPKRKREARNEGQIVKSMELNNVFTMLAILIALQFSFAGFVSAMTKYLSQSLLITDYGYKQMLDNALRAFALGFLPFGFVMLVAGVAVNYLQVGFVFTPKKLKLDLKKLNVTEGMKRVFSKRAIFEMLKSLIKLAIIIAVSYSSIRQIIDRSAIMIDLSVYDSLRSGFDTAVKAGSNILAALAVNAVIDYIYQWFDHDKSIRMSKQEIKDELKNTEGDPLIKSNIKGKQRQLASMRMMQQIKDADAVITNPTHLAIAIKYDIKKNAAPIVVAKGRGFVAEKIKALAKEHGVFIVENKPLARVLYGKTEIGDRIPFEHYKAVAEILAYVYSMKKKLNR